MLFELCPGLVIFKYRTEFRLSGSKVDLSQSFQMNMEDLILNSLLHPSPMQSSALWQRTSDIVPLFLGNVFFFALETGMF